MAAVAAADVRPENSAEFTVTPAAASSGAHSAPRRTSAAPAGATTRRISIPWRRANSKSRSSWAGTPMTAPSP